MERIYLDHCATSGLGAAARDAMAAMDSQRWGNPASQHHEGRQARRVLAEITGRTATLLGLRTGPRRDRIVWTSGGTEANNLALFGMAGAGAAEVMISAIEHPSVRLAAQRLGAEGRRVRVIPVGGDGRLRLDRFESMIRETPDALVSVMLVNHETGVVQPIRELAALCRRHGAQLHCDAVQAAGKIDVNFEQLGVDALTVAAHKFHGPVGVGALVLRHDVVLAPRLHGGFQQAGERPGTESPTLPAGLEAALAGMTSAKREHLKSLRDCLEHSLAERLNDLHVHAQGVPRAPHVSSVAFGGLDRQALMMALDFAGVACSTGAACASGSSEPSPVLLAMGVEPADVDATLRFSPGVEQTHAQMVEAARRIASVVANLRARSTSDSPWFPQSAASDRIE